MKIFLFVICLLYSFSLHAQDPEAQLKKLGLELPEIGDPAGSYVHCVMKNPGIHMPGSQLSTNALNLQCALGQRHELIF